MKMDINSGVYATYSRGEDGEGEYGDGDKVYFNDSNVYYGVDNLMGYASIIFFMIQKMFYWF